MTPLLPALAPAMTAGLELASLADDLSKIAGTPEKFASFYRKLVSLKFPLDVAEVLELRWLLNQTIDRVPPPEETSDYREFALARRMEMETIGIEKPQHAERLLKLLTVLRDHHLAHTIESRDTEQYLRKALANNAWAHRQSGRYAKGALIGAIGAAILWLALDTPTWVTQVLAGGLVYLTADYFYSLSILRREQVILQKRLKKVLDRRIASLNWKLLIKNVALILGYARISGVEAFVIDSEADLPLAAAS